MVLKENQQNYHHEHILRDKFIPNCLGPYVVKHKFGLEAYHLATLEVVE